MKLPVQILTFAIFSRLSARFDVVPSTAALPDNLNSHPLLPNAVTTNLVSLNPVPSTSIIPKYPKNAVELIRYHGFEAETHYVNNSQQYRLVLHRIVNVNNVNGSARGNAVLVHHGILCSSIDFLVNSPLDGFVFQLATLGYDVWLANARGNFYSSHNYRMSPADPRFWEYGLDEMISEDLPANIDYILTTTNQPQLDYIGHSMGCTLVMGLLASKPEYNNKVKKVIAVSPAIFLSDASGILTWYADFLKAFPVEGETLSQKSGIGKMAVTFMKLGLSFMVENILMLATGDRPGTFTKELLLQHLNHIPDGISRRMLRHFQQMFKGANYSMFDWGRQKNLILYNQTTPPLYLLTKVAVPTYIFCTERDIMTTPRNCRMLCESLVNCKGSRIVGTPNNGHLHLIWGTDRNCYQQIVEAVQMS